MTWKEFIHGLVIAHCNKNGSRTFSLKEFYGSNEAEISRFKPDNKHRLEKVRQQLQFMRNDGIITFLDNSGHYTLRGVEILKDEVDDDKVAEVSNEKPDKREYLIETYARNRGWVRLAKDRFGDYCMCQKCSNTFLKEDGEPYIEVHHIVPLFKGGEDGVWNLALLCAHHHKMAHFAELKVRNTIEKMLLSEVQCRL
jgi:predicted HNH restriction endonuclease